LNAILDHRSTEAGALRRAILAAIRWVAAVGRVLLFGGATRIESFSALAYAAFGRFLPEFCRMNANSRYFRIHPADFARQGAVSSASKKVLGAGGRAFCVLALLFLFLTPPALPDKSDVISVPFRTAQSMILVDARVNAKRVTLLLDTGAMDTIISAKAYGIPQFQLQGLHRKAQDPGLAGDSLRLRGTFAFANRVWNSQPVIVMNVDELTRRIGTQVDGLLGQDLLREFRSVRINYKSHVIELEQ
jgi:Aspartyl protease